MGHVTDFIDPTHYPAFNVADSAIVCGILAIAVLSFLDDRRARNDPPGASS
ncbi:MAG: signal peptidase II [Dehalococcoidia bacterium]